MLWPSLGLMMRVDSICFYTKQIVIRFSSYFGDYTIHITCMQNAELQIGGGIEDKSKIIFLIIFLISQQKHIM